MEYAYWTVICKTPGCSKILIPKGGYLGPRENSQQTVESAVLPPDSAEFQCPGCGNKHIYMAADFEVRALSYLSEIDSEDQDF